ncbi:MAG: energy transducer TonB [Bryobacteraceae bacterium]|jgi:TonB family protein
MQSDFQRYWHADQREPGFLIEWREPETRRRHRIAALGAVMWHVAIVLFVWNAPSGAGRSDERWRIELAMRNATPLVEPRLDEKEFKLTQKAPQVNSPAAEVDLASLLPKPQLHLPAMRPAPGSAPPGAPLPPKPSEQTIEAPHIEAPPSDNLAALKMPALPQTQPPPPPQKKSPFEPVGGPDRSPRGQGLGGPRIEVPKEGVDEAVRAMIRSGAGGSGMVVGDNGQGAGGAMDSLLQRGSPGTQRQSALELMSDPQGVDFKPYLIQVLAAVRRSWFSVMPESIRFGRSGRVVIQFAVNRNGEVTKLVIAEESGANALDRAAVAGVSGAVPFPPLPAGFKGMEARLQLVFNYNMPRQR